MNNLPSIIFILTCLFLIAALLIELDIRRMKKKQKKWDELKKSWDEVEHDTWDDS